MAAFALVPKIIVMYIIFCMAGIASHRGFSIFFHGFGVAGRALQGLMSAIQFKFRVFVMVEVPNSPVAAIVATRAFGAQRALMHVVLFVTGMAVA